MVFSSAYRRAYKEPSWDDYSKKEFISKLQYRSDRRSVEHRHQPWSWDSDSEEEDIEEIPAEDGSYDGGRHERVPRDERIIHKRAPKQAWGEERKEIKEYDRALVLPKELTYEEEEEKKTKHLQVAGDVYRPKERDRGKRDGRKQHRSSEDIKKKYRSRSTSPEKKRKSKGEKNRVPFLPYGMANEGPLDMWKTHNVLASQREVYPAALRAQKRRQQEVKKKAQLREEAVKKKEMPSHFDVDVAFPKTWWMTEYQRNFCKEEDVKRHFLR